MSRANGIADVSTAQNGRLRVKAEKVKQEKTRSTRDKGKQRARVETEDEEEEEEEEQQEEEEVANAVEEDEGEEDEGAEGSPKGSKRVRVNGEGDSRPSASLPEVKRAKTLPRDVDGYIPGSIVRIQLSNFVTYDYVQFSPGPYLNMIIGPNGTGKSSIACAIALGLNFPPSILGRASELNSFVKIGSDKGYIEIELKGARGRGNYIIRRNLSAKSKSSTFTLNGEPATGNEIKQKMMELNVQVGNLCSFLPQDKVSEFAAMSPQQLLRETQRAAGDQRLTQWHDTLIESGKELKSMDQLIKADESQLAQWIERNESIEREVQRFHERKKIEFEIALLQVLIPIEQYRYGLKEYNRLRALKKQLHEKANKLKKKNAPAHEFLKTLEKQHEKAEVRRDEMNNDTRKMFKHMRAKTEESDRLEGKWDDITNSLEGLKKQEKERQKKMRQLEGDIQSVKEELAKPPPEDLEDPEDLAREARMIQQERNVAVMQRKDELDRQASAVAQKKGVANANLQHAIAELKKNDDADVQKLHSMSRWDPNTHKAILWLRDNQNLFKQQVFEPPFMCVNVKDRKFTNQVEACFNPAQLKSFVTQSREDLNTLNMYLNDRQVLGKGVRVVTWYRDYDERSIPPPPMSREELHQLGFDGYALDYLDYPAGLEPFLKKDVMLHRTAIALNNNQVDVNAAMAAVARPIGGHGGGATFICGNTRNVVSRSLYGRKAIGNMTMDVRQARNLTVPTIDPEVKASLENDIRTAQEELVGYDAEKEAIDQERDQLNRREGEFKKRLDDVKRRRDLITQEQKRISAAQSRLERFSKQLKELRSKPKAEDEEKRLKKRLIEISRERMALSKQYLKMAKEIVDCQTEVSRLGLRFLQTGANLAALKELCKRKDEKFQKALVEFTKADEQFQKVKKESVELLNENKAMLSELSPEISEVYRVIEHTRTTYDKALKEAEEKGGPLPSKEGVDLRTVEELENELEIQKAKLDMSFRTQPGVVEEYEKRKRDIEQLQKTIENRKKNAEKVENNIRKAKDNWQPALEKLVASIGEKFSAAFDRIGCAGEIRISQHEDYDKWAIDILVKFRDSEKLQLLTGQRQSGGERSLTTILYLMSLTEEARAPFSLVDEINQGMDQRAERNVHNSLVEVTCKEESAQYFLITPKLLPDLNYHERMKVLCVNNGEWLPEEKNLGNMMSMIDTYLRCRGGGQD